MEYLRFYDLEETYINDKSSLKYFNVSYTKDTDKTWVKEEEPYLLMKFKVEEAIIIDDNYDIHKVLTRKICNNLSVFKSIQIGNDEPINVEIEEKENIIDSNSFILNENDYFTSTYVPENNINGEQQCTLVINEQFTKDDYIVYFNSFYDYPYDCYPISEEIENGYMNEINENTFDVGFMSNEYICFVIKKEGVDLLTETSTITSDMLQYIISSSLKYNEIKNKIDLPYIEGEYMVKGVLNQSIYSLNYLFYNYVDYEYTENTNIYDDIEMNNDYYNIINLISINIPKQISNLNNTFTNCKKLKEVKIDNQSNLTLIGDEAFGYCNSLTSITIPNSVESIDSYAFCCCTSLTSITIPESVTSIGDYAFADCDSLSLIEIPNSITSISNYAFQHCDSLSSITIPDSVTSIGEGAFQTCSSLSSITIPNSVTSIGNNSFSECYALNSITIPNSIESIGDYVFYYCYSLSSITIPNSVTSIGDSAFSNCYSLSSITIPNSVTSIGDFAFSRCYALTSIEIPNSVTSIGESAFSHCETLNNITIPNSVTTIGSRAFESCSSLREITCLATTAPTVSSFTFYNICSNGVLYYPQDSDYSSWLSTSNYYLGNNGWIGVVLQNTYDFKVNFITNGVRVDSPYSSLIINGIEGVEQDDNSYLFSGLQPTDSCYKFDLIADGEVIDTVDINHKNKWVLVGDNSSMLICIYNPCQNTTIYSGSNLTYSGAYVDGEYVGKISSSYTFNDVSEHIIQYEGVTSIGNSAFTKCYSLNEITIPNNVISISDYAFYKCSSLSSITIPNSVTSIGNYVFYYCFSLSEIIIPNKVKTIGSRVFEDCHSLREIEIPNSVTSISNDAFNSCHSLSSITIPNSVTSIGVGAFSNCYLLNNITIPNSVTSISNQVFSNCHSLSSITIPNSVTSIGDSTFHGCVSLTSITIPNSVTYIGKQAFDCCHSLSSIDIPDSVIEIGNEAFSYCYALNSITIHDSVTSIGQEAFNNCSSLTSVTIPNSVESIGSSAFTDCYLLRSITIGNSVTSIGNNAFTDCYSLNSITIPNSVTSIGDGAFSDCDSLRKITCLATTAPTISSSTFENIKSNGVLYYPQGSDYSSWLSTDRDYLGYYNWAFQEI